MQYLVSYRYTIVIQNFKDFTPFIVVIKYVIFLSYTIHPVVILYIRVCILYFPALLSPFPVPSPQW